MLKQVVALSVMLTASQSYACNLPLCKPEPKVIYHTTTVEKPSPVVANPYSVSDAKADAKAGNQTQATTGQQVITINMPQATKPFVIKRTKYRTKKVIVYKTNPNRLLFLVGQTKTKQTLQFDCCDVKATRAYELDYGLQYIRDFGAFSGSLAYTVNKSYYIGLGVNW